MGSTQQATSHKPLQFPSAGFEVLNGSELIEEELAEGYNAKNYYPVKQGEVFNGQYQAILKLGFGATSTIWLSKDFHSGDYVALKVCTTNSERERELPVYEHINSIKKGSKSPGKQVIRDLITHFTISGPSGKHICLVQEPLGANLRTAQLLNPGMLDAYFIKALLCEVLEGLDFLHNEAKVVHTDIQPSNLMWSLFDKSVFTRLEESEQKCPSPRKVLKDRSIYLSTDLEPSDGELRLCDFGEARVEGDREGLIMSDAFRAPEAIMNLAWGYPVDIWGLVQTAWLMLEGTPMFECEDEEGQYNVEVQFASMIAALGPAPLNMIKEDKEDYLEIWDENGGDNHLAELLKPGG
ncbi:protein kinase [Diaporthe amygdali]|uniref:protein kinase n=1 Tax=Phomopsis amygdali TaxID=1214568 RepID=UPI0022FE4EA9|nr:protein kinase [Diaporthe amygdali]KAJ0120499.1 protein kinase [Diaporthe amygdali]